MEHYAHLVKANNRGAQDTDNTLSIDEKKTLVCWFGSLLSAALLTFTYSDDTTTSYCAMAGLVALWLSCAGCVDKMQKQNNKKNTSISYSFPSIDDHMEGFSDGLEAAQPQEPRRQRSSSEGDAILNYLT